MAAMGGEVTEVAGDLRRAASYLQKALTPAISDDGWALTSILGTACSNSRVEV